MIYRTLNLIFSKLWGQTQCFFACPISEAHYLEINEKGYCSEHCHKHKWNRFFLISGKLKITVYRENGVEDITILHPKQSTDVPPGVYHKFEALEDSTCIETYWIDMLDMDDIERRTIGGKGDLEDMKDKFKKDV